ncbi:MAG: tRNA 2-thiouridine(34) synthase MnmA [bacterium]|nr:tRNA 2-thiouridine(34) synthase MnmA [bacterium]
MRVLTAMSGGVDSSVAALLLQRQGHDVVGVFMRNGVSGLGGPASVAQEKSCCSASDARDAALVSDRLGIPFYSVDYAEEFGGLIDHFAAEYRRGRTPNPCVLCNTQLKFGHLFRLADDVGAAAVATGHYARAVDGQLLRARDTQKDQTYYLFGVERESLRRALFPLGDLTKAEVRAIAADAGFSTAAKPESMEICFVTSGDYRDVVRTRGGGGRSGRFLNAAGAEVGRHDGVDGFTVGQRRGLPALGTPHYVGRIDPESGDVLLVERQGLAARSALVRAVHWLIDDPAPDDEIAASVKVRARQEPVAATIRVRDAATVELRFDAPVDAVTPGQAAVFYRQDRVLGGGWLD